MPRKTTTSSTKKKAPKKSVEKKSSTERQASSTAGGGGLGVVIVLLVGVLLIGAVFMAVQNAKTRNLQDEVFSLQDKLEGKLHELSDELNTQKEEQEKVKAEANKLPKQYESKGGYFTLRYPATFVISQVDQQGEKDLKEQVTLVKEVDKAKKFPDASDGGPAILSVTAYENTEGLSLLAWITAFAEDDYYTNFSKDYVAVDELSGGLVYKMEPIGSYEYLTYTWRGLGGADEYFIMNGDHVIRAQVQFNEENDPLRAEALEVLTNLSF